MRHALTGLSLTCLLAAAPPRDLTRHVDPLIGSAAHAHTFPGAQVPFGMVQLSPDTRLTGWDGCSGYQASDRVIYGFSHTHLSGTGCSDYGDILLLPATGAVKLKTGYRGVNDDVKPRDPSGYGSAFRKETEKAEAGYYGVELDDYAVKAELTSTARVGFHRYTFRKAGASHILLDLTHRDEVLDSAVKVVSPTELEGYRRAKAWSADRRWYFVARFSRPVQADLAVDDQIRAGLKEAKGKNLKVVLNLTTKAGEQVQVKVGLSPTSIAGARRNLEAEVKGWSFDGVRQAARAAWNRELSKIQVEGGSDADQTTFYTALYHSMQHPNLAMDVDGSYLGRDFRVHKADGHGYYTVFSLWDTFRALHPLLALVDRKRTGDFIQTFQRQFEQGGRLPVWELSSNETFCMIGYHAVPVIWDAWQKGIRPVPGDRLLEAMTHSAREDRGGLKAYRAFGHIPADAEPESVSKTLEYSYDDACIAQMAKALGREPEAAEFGARSQFWKNVFDPATRFMRGRANGRWVEPFDPREVNFHYTEANSWQYSFMVPHDIPGLIARHGGPEPFAARVEDMFTTRQPMTGRQQSDITGLIGQYAHGNEPSHHVAYLYSFAGQPWKTQERVAQVRDTLYGTGPEGLCGNDDCGQMSAWHVFSALGFYPVTPGSNQYVIGTPKFRSARIRLENGRSFTVQAKGSGPYIQSATLNGKPWHRAFLVHEDVAKGGEVVFTLGTQPNRAWGSALEDRPGSPATEAPLLTAPYVAEGPRVATGPIQVRLACAEPGATIRYTLDGTEPTEASAAATGPFALEAPATLRMRAFKAGMVPSHPVRADFARVNHAWKLSLLSAPNPQYTAGGDQALIDGLRGGEDFRTGGWQGFEGKDLEAVVDFGALRPVQKLRIGFLQDHGSWIFLPTDVTFLGSADGQTWTPLGTVANPIDPRTEGSIRQDFTLAAPAGSTMRYLKVVGRSLKVAPAWHKGAGGPAFLFADEILVD